MSVTNFLVTGLPSYVATNRDLIIKSFGLVGTGTRGRIGLQTGVKKVAALNYLALNAAFQDGSECGFNALDEITLSQKNITVAVMGCAVNGPGEAAAADIGIAGGKGEGLIFRKGEILYKVPQEQLVDALMAEIEKL